MMLDFSALEWRADPTAKPPPHLRDLRGVTRPALDTDEAELVIIDAQNEYAEGPLKLEGMTAAVAEIARLRSWARRNGVPVIYVRQVSPTEASVCGGGS